MYMVQQWVTTAVREGYRGADGVDVEQALAGARAARSWLASLAIDSDVRATLIEPIAAVEEALAECVRQSSRPQADPATD